MNSSSLSHSLAQYLDSILYSYDVTTFIQHHVDQATDVKAMLACTHPRWSDGNLLHGLVTRVLMPPIRDCEYEDLSYLQQKSILFIIYKLVLVYDMDISKRDLFNQTPLDIVHEVECITEGKYLIFHMLRVVFSQNAKERKTYLINYIADWIKNA